MKYSITVLFMLFTALTFAQGTGSVVGKLTDKDFNNEPLAFANVFIKGTTKGTTSDFDGLYELANLEPGTYTVVYSFVGYETVEIDNVQIVADKVTTVNVPMGASAAALDEVVIKTTTRKDSEVALLIEQKKAVEIKESIGADQLAKMGVSDASTATTKISGVNRTDGSGDIYVRGLGDRYLYTTLNGLPIPSDDVEKKNIDLGLFPTRLVQSVSVAKTTSPRISADQASGNIDIASRELRGSSELEVAVRSSVNTNVMSEVSDNFLVSPNQDDVTFGFYQRDFSTRQAITQQSWSTQVEDLPVNRRVALTAGTKIGEKFRVLLTASQRNNYEYRSGVFREFRSNFIVDTITDANTWRKEVTSSALLNMNFRADNNNRLRATSLFINRLQDIVFEGGRDGNSTIFEETAPSEGLFQFIRDQNLKKTTLWVNQLGGTHDLNENNKLDWALGYNWLSADEPNRIRNEVNFDKETSFVQLGRNGGFQQRKSNQQIEDIEYNGRLSDEITIIDDQATTFKVVVGGNYRNKTRDFSSLFLGVEEAFTNAINPESIDLISDIFTQENFDNGILQLNELPLDTYDGTLQSVAGFADFIGEFGKVTLEAGLRYQKDDIDVNFDVNNFPGRLGSSSKDYRRLYPSVNVKYAINDKHAIRFANSATTTLPEFKEIAPFEYVSPVGQITRGNPDIEASFDLNYDLKWEFFPSNDELISLTGFYKSIEDPINRVQDRGAAGIFSYFNSGEEATVFGVEVEARLNIIDGDDRPNLRVNFNASRMWHEQDLKEITDENGNVLRTFRYNNLTDIGLEGASDWIVNTSLNFDTNSENPFDVTVTGNYASDRIFAIGAPEFQSSGDINYNDAIIEKGFVTLDAVLRKQFGEHWRVGLRGRNLLNPTIKRTQKVKPSTTGIETEETVLSYTRGMQLGFNINYSF